MDDNIQPLLKREKLLQNATKIEKISKGYSPDKKYIVYHDEYKVLVRICDMESYEKKKIEFQLLNEMSQLHVQSPKPIQIGVIDDLNFCYTIHSFIEGVDAKDALHTLTEKDQYKIGIEAGKQLAKMHSYKAPSSVEPWYDRAMKKHDKYVNAYKSSGVKIKNDEKIIDFIERNKHYLINRPNRFQHDDFHLENIIVKNKQFSGVIDFNNFDWGDPLHDFVKVGLFQRGLSIPFSIGQIKGYFDLEIPDEFWRLYSIYVAMVIFSSVVWTLRFAPEQVDEMISRLEIILEDHKEFELVKPTWFERNQFAN